MNCEKRVENLTAELKKQENQFERQKAKTEEFQNKYNETQLRY